MKLFNKNIFNFNISFLLLFTIDVCLVYQLFKWKRYFFQGDWHDLASHDSKILLIGNSSVCFHLNPFDRTLFCFYLKFNSNSHIKSKLFQIKGWP